jgi:phosphatidylglycerol:prolipoprotein diacylglycerol transferase
MTVAAPLVLAEIFFPWVDPVALDLPGPVDVRWYGLMYLLGFAAGYVVLRRLVRTGDLALPPSAVGDLVGALVLGVLVGGRLGYLLFYDLRDVAARPLEALRVWEGGMSFHGGLLGVAVALVSLARRRRAPVLNLADAIALAAPFGIAAVRLANFINGELYGRLAGPGIPWAVRFPTDPAALRLLGADGFSLRERERRIQAAYESGLWEAVREQVPLRHPSQLYEALGEGVLLGAALWSLYAWCRRQRRETPPGTYAGLFLVGYGVARFVVEFFRQPDAQFRGPSDPLGTVLGPLTMGQTLSTVMLLAGVGILARTWRPSRRAGGEHPAADGADREP